MKHRVLNVLLADNDRQLSFVVSTILRGWGHTVAVADGGEEAIRIFTLKPDFFDVLITDHNMPPVSGLELVQHLRKNGVRAKIIVISSTLTNELMTAYRDKHVDKILQKPFMLENLSFTLDDVLTQWNGAASASM